MRQDLNIFASRMFNHEKRLQKIANISNTEVGVNILEFLK